MTKLYTTKIRLYPTEEQEQQLAQVFGTVRFVYNNSLNHCKEQYLENKKTPNYHALAIRLPSLKKEFDWMKDSPSQALQMACRTLSVAFERFFQKKSKYPVFKSRHDKQSFQLPQGVKVNHKSISIPKIGEIKAVVHRNIFGDVKTVTLSKNKSGQYFASILSKTDEIIPNESPFGKITGIDLGLKDFLITSEGVKYENPKFERSNHAKTKKLQRRLSKKKKGSKNREKARIKLAKHSQKITNKRDDYLHKLSREITNKNQVVCLENLAVKNMMKCHNLARAIGDVSWSKFVTMLDYKLGRDGKILIQVDRFFPSSKTCNRCGHSHKNLKLNDRDWKCVSCGERLDRDINAAINIRNEGFRILTDGSSGIACGDNVRLEMKISSNQATICEAGSPRL